MSILSAVNRQVSWDVNSTLTPISRSIPMRLRTSVGNGNRRIGKQHGTNHFKSLVLRALAAYRTIKLVSAFDNESTHFFFFFFLEDAGEAITLNS